MKCFHKTRHKTLFVLNCQSKNCVVCGSRIDSIKKTDLIKKTDSIVMKIDSICATFNSIVSTIDSVKKTDSIMSMQNHQLNGVPRSTLILPCLSQSSNNQVDPSTIESILQQSSRFFSNRVDSLTPTTPTGHTQKSSQQSRLVFKPICFTTHLRHSPVALKAGRQKQRKPDKVKNYENHDWHEACLLTALLCSLVP